jgi:hypothetical protein
MLAQDHIRESVWLSSARSSLGCCQHIIRVGIGVVVRRDKDKAIQLFEEALVTISALGAKTGVKKVKMALEKLT